MINLRILFGWVPKTADYEAKQDALRKEYADLKAFAQSKELADYLELEKTVTSPDFAHRKKAIMAQRYANTDECRKEKEYLRLKKQKDIQRYYRLKDSVELKDFLEFENSQDVKHYHTLEKLVHSAEFESLRKSKGKEFKNTPEYEKWQEFNTLKETKRFKDFFAFRNSKDYTNFTLLIGSEKITGFETLEKLVNSDEFQKIKEYMLLPAKKKIELSDEYRMEQQYLEWKKSDKFKWYFSTVKAKKFDEIRRWELTFADEFDTPKLDMQKWLTRYFYADAILKDSYVNMAEKQFYPAEGNVQVDKGILKITTRREKASGKVWNPAIGFFPKEFEYTSGIVNTGKSFRQQFGLFEAKIRFNRNYPVNHGMWLVSNVMLPHIDVARAGRKISFGSFWGNPNAKGGVDKKVASVSRNRYGFDYCIFSLEWTSSKLTWKINGVPVQSTTQGVPQVPMYININSALYNDANGSVLPAELEVDWVRCYKQA